MKICLLGEYSGYLDEGMRKSAFYLAEELSKNNHVYTIDIRKIRNYLKIIKNVKPEIVHFLHGPTINSLLLLKIISICIYTKTVVSAMHPRFSVLSEKIIPLIRPDIVLTQSEESENMFNKLGCNTKFLPCGVDMNIFMPSSIKDKLREKYGIDKKKFIILHVGSIKKGRNIQLLEKLQKDDNQVIIIGAVSVGIDFNLAHQLEKSGCIIWTEYFKNIHEIYLMSDCYIFPVLNTKDMLGKEKAISIEMPLSVLEAMSCNLPVIVTKFGALPKVFEERNGLFFAEDEKDFFDILNNIKNTDMSVRTRELVQPYSWEKIGKKLQDIYYELINGDNNSSAQKIQHI